jgi:hypothetical protein
MAVHEQLVDNEIVIFKISIVPLHNVLRTVHVGHQLLKQTMKRINHFARAVIDGDCGEHLNEFVPEGQEVGNALRDNVIELRAIALDSETLQFGRESVEVLDRRGNGIVPAVLDCFYGFPERSGGCNLDVTHFFEKIGWLFS